MKKYNMYRVLYPLQIISSLVQFLQRIIAHFRVCKGKINYNEFLKFYNERLAIGPDKPGWSKIYSYVSLTLGKISEPYFLSSALHGPHCLSHDLTWPAKLHLENQTSQLIDLAWHFGRFSKIQSHIRIHMYIPYNIIVNCLKLKTFTAFMD